MSRSRGCGRTWSAAACPFWEHYTPVLREMFREALAGVTPQDVYREANRVQPSLIRVEADEVTYNLHILIRFELELALLRGELEVADLPGEWDAAYDRRLGVRPPHAGVGVLQDVHWSTGSFGYFPTYTLGNLYSAILWEQIAADLPDIDGQIGRAEFAPLLDWLRERIHRAGHLQEGDDLVHEVTGGAAPARPVHALPVGQVRTAVRPRGAGVKQPPAASSSSSATSPRSRARRGTSAPSPTCARRLRALGLDPVEDGSGARTGSNIGNIHVALPPSNGADGTPIFLNAHLDTVPPDGPVEPEIRNGIVVNRRDTILGADNKAAVAVMLEAVARLGRVRRTPGWSFC